MTDIGTIGSTHFFVYAAMNPVVGFLADRLGPRVVIGSSSILACGGIFLSSFASSFSTMVICRAVLAMGGSGSYVPTMRLAASWAAPEHFAFLTSILISSAGIGGVLAGAPWRAMVDSVGWRVTYRICAVVTGLCGAAMLIFGRDTPEDMGLVCPWKTETATDNADKDADSGDDQLQEARQTEAVEEVVPDSASEPDMVDMEDPVGEKPSPAQPRTLVQLLKSSQIWLVFAIFVLVSSPALAFKSVIAARILIDGADWTDQQAGFALSFQSISSILVPPIAAAWAAKWSRKNVLLCSPPLTALVLFLMMAFIRVETPHAIIYCLYFLFNAFGPGLVTLCYSYIKEAFHDCPATAIGISNLGPSCGASLNSQLMPWIVAKTSVCADGFVGECRSREGYSNALLSSAVGVLLGLPAVILLPRITKKGK
eukprot:gnl/Dysnectes_brevis/2561_a3085_585.p1 GENE.gnl/Dysnectes_brevis/2561_a3085_585~~gnl/Dysnectes_brevis/2561_a3085_585.p1  ORF type:complete len:467 (-),score=137.05 gnl/Dysnectes_brevis/2561_a3085_585:1370-2647(-)